MLTGRVPYAKLRRAERDARTANPDATSVKALWSPSSRCEIVVEIWQGGRASVVGWEPSR